MAEDLTEITDAAETVADAIRESFIDYETEGHPCITEAIGDLVKAAHSVAHAITPRDASPGPSAVTGDGRVGSLTEAVMDVAAGLKAIADAIGGLAERMPPPELPEYEP